MTPCNELGFYTLAGHSDSPRDLVDEVQRAEELGLGAAFISERFNLKDAAVLSGAAGAVSEHDRHRDRGHQSQHPPPAGDGDDGDDDAPTDRRPLRPRSRPRLRSAVQARSA